MQTYLDNQYYKDLEIYPSVGSESFGEANGT